VHAPLTHVWLLHADTVPQVPLDVQVCTPLPEHCVWPATHTPVQAPLTHVWLLHATAVPQVPLDWHVCTPLPEHCV
jgi:hypothetical protein